MSFKPGDLVMIVAVPGANYPPDAQPGTVATVEHRCACSLAALHELIRGTGSGYYKIQIPTRSLCAAAVVLRKINGEDHQVVRWDQVPWQPEQTRASA